MARFIRVTVLLCIAIVLLSAFSFKTALAKSVAMNENVSHDRFSTGSCQWYDVPSPIEGDYLSGVAAVSATDIWAVGTRGSDFGGYFTLIEQWNGSRWQIVKSPNPDPLDNGLDAVSAISASDVWAVGAYNGQTLTEHWNGSQWSVVPSPNPTGVLGSGLYGVTAVSTNDVWAVGYNTNSINTETTLIEHWNGSSWSIVTSPNPGTSPINDVLSGVTAISANDVWAVGGEGDYGGYGQTLIEHWNGASWSVVKSPNNNSFDSVLQGVSAVSASDVWAVGNPTLIEHWDGTSWSIVTSPIPGLEGTFQGVSAISTNDVWAVGSYESSNYEYNPTLTEHWNGTSWSIVPSPSTKNAELMAVAALSSTHVWAVGTANNYPLTENYHC